jgi:hypothetical protein
VRSKRLPANALSCLQKASQPSLTVAVAVTLNLTLTLTAVTVRFGMSGGQMLEDCPVPLRERTHRYLGSVTSIVRDHHVNPMDIRSVAISEETVACLSASLLLVCKWLQERSHEAWHLDELGALLPVCSIPRSPLM